MKESQNKPGWLVIAGVVIFVVAVNLLPQGSYSTQGLDLISGVYVLVLGSLFLFAYFFEASSILFRGLMWLCVHGSVPAGRKMAFFYAGLSGALGTIAILQGLGVIHFAR